MWARSEIQAFVLLCLSKNEICLPYVEHIRNFHLLSQCTGKWKSASRAKRAHAQISHVHAIYTRAFSDKAVLGIVQDAEIRCGLNSPFDAMHNMYYLSSRAADPADRSWVLMHQRHAPQWTASHRGACINHIEAAGYLLH